jgi:hypothetical protein
LVEFFLKHSDSGENYTIMHPLLDASRLSNIPSLYDNKENLYDKTCLGKEGTLSNFRELAKMV